ncbi:hypothetical protein [Burkholderia pseudomallei]|uniref:hypothetical protein n=1 Tax=Burkholderia pseudomallei TaxID=28450 RepID=UPI00015F7C87|nr:hypothetical protein [Burkholderia pseudomallei]AJX62734.1 putative signal peptide protein [Burkholderia pseudomallei Pasteur 52237]EDO95618.1 putative signal peptide [Burkholderia pseudomallei Pasteur 52237]MWA22322.1 hypothetical protein [Burkholderia pseudomallei]VBQ80723.1 bacteriophage protein [Burkholderia pseudomallei]
MVIFATIAAALRFAVSHWRITVAALVTALLFWLGWHFGAVHVTAQWESEKAAAAAAIKRVDTKQSAVSDAVQTKVVTQVKVVHDQGQTIYKQVPFYVPSTAPALPGSFRVLYDSAAAGMPLPDAASGAHAAAVPAQDLARTDVENLTGCRANAKIVSGWQEWAASEAAAAH